MKKTFLFVCIIFSFFTFSISLFTDEEEILEKLKNDQDYQRINKEVQSITCNWDDITFLYDDYKTFFGERWSDIKSNYKCEYVRDFIIEKERKRLTFNLDFKTPKEGITGSIFFLFGHYVRPPYKVELKEKEKTVTVNGVGIADVVVTEVIKPEIENQDTDYKTSHTYYLFSIALHESKLKMLEKKKINEMINTWSIKYKTKDILNRLTEYLETSKDSGDIYDFWIYDKDKVLYDIRYKYVEYDNIPQKYYHNENEWKELVENNPKLEYTDKQIMQDEEKEQAESLKIAQECIINDLSEKNGIVIYMAPRLGSITFSMTLNSLKEILYTMLSDSTEYQKIVRLNSLLHGEENSGQVVFNFDRNDYLYLYKILFENNN